MPPLTKSQRITLGQPSSSIMHDPQSSPGRYSASGIDLITIMVRHLFQLTSYHPDSTPLSISSLPSPADSPSLENKTGHNPRPPTPHHHPWPSRQLLRLGHLRPYVKSSPTLAVPHTLFPHQTHPPNPHTQKTHKNTQPLKHPPTSNPPKPPHPLRLPRLHRPNRLHRGRGPRAQPPLPAGAFSSPSSSSVFSSASASPFSASPSAAVPPAASTFNTACLSRRGEAAVEGVGGGRGP